MADDPIRLHWSAVGILEAFGRTSSIGRRRYMLIATLQVEPTEEEDRMLREGMYPLGENQPLPSKPNSATLSTMSTATIEAPRRGRPFGAQQHPFVLAMIKARKSVIEVAKDLKCSPAAVRSWYKAKDSPDLRPIPRAQAEWLRDHMGVPLKAWQRRGW